MGIIVFAISLSLFLERWRENVHDRHLEKEFLTNLREDMQMKLKELRGDYSQFNYLDTLCLYLKNDSNYKENGKKEVIAKVQSLNGGIWMVIEPNNVLFESIKQSGKLYVIQNRPLSQRIINFYQHEFPLLTGMYEKWYYPHLSEWQKAFTAKIDVTNVNSAYETMHKNNEIKQRLYLLHSSISIVGGGYKALILQAEKIMADIDAEIKK
jgi:hypothetical protein